MKLDSIIEAIGIEPYYREDAGVIYCADCLDILPRMPEKCVDLVCTDPFYVPRSNFDWKNFTDFYWEFTEKWLNLLRPVIKNDYHLFVSFSSEDMANFERSLTNTGFNINSRIVWHYRNAGGRCRATNRFGKTYEFIFHCSSGIDLNFPDKWDDRRFDVQIMATPQSNFKDIKYHQFQKPFELIKRLVEFGSLEYNLILDPFLGSGTTAVATKQLDRKFIGIEIEEKYCAIARERLSQEVLSI